MSSDAVAIRDLAEQEYKWGFVTDIEEDRVPKGLNEGTIRLISARKNEPEFMLEWRLRAFRHWASLEQAQAEPKWANIHYGPIDYQDIVYYSAPKQKPVLDSLDDLDPEILRTYEKLGIPSKSGSAWPVLRSMRCSTVFPLVRPSRRSCRRSELSSVHSRKRYKSTPPWCRSIWVRWCPIPTTSSLL